MSLVPREQETLTAIENRFHLTDPRFAAMFRLLGSVGPRTPGPLWVFLSVRVARRGVVRVITELATIVTLLTACAVAAALLA
jgi:hypothetical protein